jgi:hypothetical protein
LLILEFFQWWNETETKAVKICLHAHRQFLPAIQVLANLLGKIMPVCAATIPDCPRGVALGDFAMARTLSRRFSAISRRDKTECPHGSLALSLLPRASAHKLAFRTNDDVFPLLADILSTCWVPAARSGESGWKIAERKGDEFISSSQCEH